MFISILPVTKHKAIFSRSVSIHNGVHHVPPLQDSKSWLFQEILFCRTGKIEIQVERFIQHPAET